jgi:hypothetical protein
MALSKSLWFRGINDSLHVLSAGIVPGAAMAVWMARGSAKATLDPAVFTGLVQSWTWVLLILLVALVVLVITGAVRLSYRTLNIVPEALPAKGRAALLKHGLFVALFVYSTVIAFMAIQP